MERLIVNLIMTLVFTVAIGGVAVTLVRADHTTCTMRSCPKP